MSARQSGPATRPPRWVAAVVVASPCVVLALLGLLHPGALDVTTAHRWWTLHVWLLPVFPLVGGSVWLLLRGTRGALPALARVAAYGFAVAYTGLDLLAGLGAGLVLEQEGGYTPTVGRLFEVGDRLGAVGVWSLAAAGLLTGAALGRTHGVRVVPGAVVLVASFYPFLVNHVLPPRGVLAVLGVGLGLALLAVATTDRDTGCPDPGAGAIIGG